MFVHNGFPNGCDVNTYNSTAVLLELELRLLWNTNRKSYLASQMQPSACCSDDQKFGTF